MGAGGCASRIDAQLSSQDHATACLTCPESQTALTSLVHSSDRFGRVRKSTCKHACRHACTRACACTRHPSAMRARGDARASPTGAFAVPGVRARPRQPQLAPGNCR
eukprot:2041300-Pleurochrysis_carterae.AAC.2